MKTKRGARASEAQKIFLVEFLKDRPKLAIDKFPTPKGLLYRDNEWEKLSGELNAIEGATKDAFKWRKYWKDLTISVRNRDNSLKEKISKSGINGFLPMREQSHIDRTILSILTPETIKRDPCSANREDFEEINIAVNNQRAIALREPKELSDTLCNEEFYPHHFEAELSLSLSGSEKYEDAVPPPSTPKRPQKRKRSFSTSTNCYAFKPPSPNNDNFLKFYLKIEEKKLKLKERQIALMEESNRKQIEIKNSLDCLLQELRNKKDQ